MALTYFRETIMETELIVLIYHLKHYDDDRPSKCEIYLGGKLLGVGTSAATHGARLLLQLGYDENRLMTTQSLYSKYHSWEPRPIREWASITVTESKNGDIRTRPYIPFPNML